MQVNEPIVLCDGRVTLFCGDNSELSDDVCKHVAGEACLTLTDPPYMIGAISAGDKKSKNGSFHDLLNFGAWYAQWFKVYRDLGGLAVFGNWRSIIVYQKAFSIIGEKIDSCVVWDKEWIGPGHSFRPSWEMIMTSGVVVSNRSARDVMRCKWQAAHSGKTGHPAEKPVELLIDFINATQSDVIIDPYMGSGSTGVAALMSGRKFVGVEIDPAHFEIARQRIEKAWAMMQEVHHDGT